ncbi:hypothetical protein GA0074695_3827 [Micromonospora viridifaciens]|uniref:Uncharacterized protein n=1 Tax=Micromonospora viridifaciens TaxID=1881 RepID=A0A1C4Y4I4_MICVI|nr:hypothetical protein [Micromonospora viridifaciens]SCF15301.1 hypothetical protein GA0074695_3827 [Micromonospora viridifaciens]
MPPDPAPLRVGITGHINLTPATERLVADALRVELRRISDRPVHGVTCLAAGADQIFARAVLATGGTYEVILPARDYRSVAIGPDHRAAFDELLENATEVVHTGHDRSGTAAYVAANRELLRRVQRLVAVWDGEPGCHDASTDRTVEWARQRGIPTTVLWPTGARRTPTVD